MSIIRVIYSEEPNFPATDNSYTAIRYQINGYWVDAEDGEPTVDEVNNVIATAKGA